MKVLYLEDDFIPQKDKWSLTNPVFGEKSQLAVIGYFNGQRLAYGKTKPQKYYIVECSVCKLDAELFGSGLFSITKSHLMQGRIPCGCSLNPKWTKDQWVIRARRMAQDIGYQFNGLIEEWNNQRTKISMSCESHGEWRTSNIGDLLDKGSGCPSCRIEGFKKPDIEMISSFLASGTFHPDTKFWRSEKIGNQGWKEFWNVYCPRCEDVSLSRANSLQMGFHPCGCGGVNRQRECYINIISNEHGVIAIKFGIANNSEIRIRRQQSYCKYLIEQHSVYTFPTVTSCKSAERECKDSFICNLLSKEEMPDGYTETTSSANLTEIVGIFEKHGGVLC